VFIPTTPLSFSTVGKIPQSVCSLSKLETLDLSDNNLEGAIPDSIGSLKRLKRLFLYKNKLTGERVTLFELNHSVVHIPKLTYPTALINLSMGQ